MPDSLLSADNPEKSWLQAFLESHDSGYGEPNFRIELARAYSDNLTLDYPEFDDDFFRDAVIKALGELTPPTGGRSTNAMHFSSLVHWIFSLLMVKAGRVELIKELKKKLKVGYASAQLQQWNLYRKKMEIAAARVKFEQDPLRIAENRELKKAQRILRAAEHAARKRETDWRFYEVEPIWGRDMSVSRFIEKIKRENRTLDWRTFVEGLVPAAARQESELKNCLRQITSKPAIYWYPGSGLDFKPLILDAPNNPTGRRMFRLNEPDFSTDPILFWMNDHGPNWLNELQPKTFRAHYCWPINRDEPEGDDEHYDKWGRYGATLSVASKREDYLFNGFVPITLFTVNIQNNGQSAKTRPISGDSYLVVFSNTPSHVLFEEIIFPMRLNVVCTVLAAQGGFSGQLRGFEQYRDIPKLLRKCEDELGPVDLYLLDDQAHDDKTRRPNSPYIRHYEYVGGPVRIGWYPCRAFGRPGLNYRREPKLARPLVQPES